MDNQLIHLAQREIKDLSDQLISDVHKLVMEAGNEEMIQIITDLRNRLHDPFMFVIVGEVKSGKSSFINALLDTGKEVCAVAPSPMTDTIQQIVYGEEASEQRLSSYLKRIYQPIEILKEIAIVDTPGTNTIIDHHQEITERFIPASDLIVFVFEAKNPYRQSAWEFFDLIHEDWKKKIIFVLQQKDLLPEKDLLINEEGVRKHAMQHGVKEPQIFKVSAKQELEGDKAGSGYEELRQFIQKNITGGKAHFLKIESSLNTSSGFIDKVDEAISLRARQLISDRKFRKEISHTLNEQSDRSIRQVDLMIDHLLSAYDLIWNSRHDELKKGLSFFSLLKRSITSMFSKKENLKNWLINMAKEIEEDMQQKLYYRLDTDVNDLADAIQNMVKFIDLKIQSEETILSKDMALFRDIAEKRGNVLRDLREAFSTYINNQDNFKNESLFPEAKDVSPSVATGSGIAIIGVVLTAVTNGAVFDISGGIVTTVGLLFAGITAGLNRSKVVGGFDQEMEKGKERLQTSLRDNLYEYINEIRDQIETHFEKFDDYLKTEEASISSGERQLKNVKERMSSITRKLSAYV
jgi:tRNA U34 5-carboxymethylaminomethyl modifying GTPase MnmE/TrmE